MKKAFIAGFLFLSILFVSAPNARAATVTELQAQISALLAQIAALQAQLGQSTGGTATSPTTVSGKFCYTFIRNLKLGDGSNSFSEPMVSALQTALEKEGFVISLDEKKAGSVFGKSTEAAVIGFQEKYAEEILTPNGLTNGNGFVGVSTRIKLNDLYGCSGQTVPVTPAANPKITLTASPTVITSGQSTTISWSSTNATVCLSPDPNVGVKNDEVGPSGSVVVSPTQNTTYYIYCYNGRSINGSIPPRADKSVMVYVNQTTSKIGDVNGDGSVTCADATMISEYSVGLTKLTVDQKSRADVNGDGFVNIIDAQQIVRNNGLNCSTIGNLPPVAFDYSLSNDGNKSGLIPASGLPASFISASVTRNTISGAPVDLALSISGLPNGVSVSSSPLLLPSNANLGTYNYSFIVYPNATFGTYPITITSSGSGAPTRTTVFNLSIISVQTTVPTNTSAPTAYLNNASDQKNSVVVTSGSSVNFIWGATNFTKCQMFKNGALFNDGVYNSYGVNVPSYSGTFYVPNQTQSATYTLTCTGAGGSQSGSVAVSISGQATTPTPTPSTSVNDPYSANYSQTSTIPLSSTEKTVNYTYTSYPCGGLMTDYINPGSVSVGNGPVYASASTACSPATPNTTSFRVYSCRNNASLQGQATFAFQCNAVTSSLNIVQPNYASVYESLRGLLQQISNQLVN